jgi:DNA polymerase-3 subunit delta'
VLRRGRLAHAYLLAGPPGIGKRLFAIELAKALLCEQPPGELVACDQCPSCLQIEAGTHPDFFLTGRPPESLDVPIAAIRELCRSFGLKPARGRRKVAILDDADDLNAEAANCFLKTLEEPPPGAVLLLIGTSADRQLPTILSRCQIVRFAPLSDALVEELLRADTTIDAELVPLLVRLGQGSPGQARALADPALWQFRQKVLQGLVEPNADPVAQAQEWIHFLEEAGKESAMQRQRAALLLRLLIEFLRDSLRVSSGGTPALAGPEDEKALQALVQKADADMLVKLLERCLEADTQIERKVPLALIVEALLDALDRILNERALSTRR